MNHGLRRTSTHSKSQCRVLDQALTRQKRIKISEIQWVAPLATTKRRKSAKFAVTIHTKIGPTMSITVALTYTKDGFFLVHCVASQAEDHYVIGMRSN
jgi:hypothetical protein